MVKFFLGGKSKPGFYSLFEELQGDGWYVYVLKGGPGSGKSSLMKRLASALEEKGHEIERIPCASDPDSLDAFLDYDLGVAMLDGTAPHVIDPVLPGAGAEILYTGDAWNGAQLRQNRQEIARLCAEIDACHADASADVVAAAALLERNYKSAAPYINRTRQTQFFARFATMLPAWDGEGRERKRLLRAVSVGETVRFDESLRALCPVVYGLEDAYGAAGDALLKRILMLARDRREEIIVCPDAISGGDTLEAVLLPHAGVAVAAHAPQCPFAKEITVADLYTTIPVACESACAKRRERAELLLADAAESVKESKTLHDGLERYYVGAMDFAKLDGLFGVLLQKLLS